VTLWPNASSPFVVIVNDAWVRKYFPGQDVLGKRLRFGYEGGGNAFNAWRTIVGVVADTHDFGLDLAAPPVFYLPQPQLSESQMVIVARTSVRPERMAQVIDQLKKDDNRFHMDGGSGGRSFS